MTNYCGDDSSSSEDENVKQALREATDQDFFKDSLFSGDKNNEEEIKTNDLNKFKEKKEENNGFYNFGVSVHFQEFVGKKLREHLDREIEIVEVAPEKCKKKKKVKGGIKLLSDSTDVINCEEEILPVPEKKKRKLKDRSENNISNFEKCKQAAIDPEFILSKSEVGSWNERQKGTVFKYKKMANGTLIEDN